MQRRILPEIIGKPTAEFHIRDRAYPKPVYSGREACNHLAPNEETAWLGVLVSEKYYYFYGMKIKPLIYFLLIVTGGLLVGFGGQIMLQEYAMIIGIVLIMFGIYKTSVSWTKSEPNKED